MKDAASNHVRNLKRDRLLTEKEKERLLDRKEKSKLAINDARIRKKLSNWFKTLTEVSLIFNSLPEEQTRTVVTDENVFELLCLAARAMKLKGYCKMEGTLNDPLSWDMDPDRCEPSTLRRCSTELYKAKFGEFLVPNRKGSHKLDENLVKILQTGAVIHITELLEGLGLDSADPDVATIVEKQIEGLEDFGLVERTADGWLWMSRSEYKEG
jgi:hypothetical protein